MKYYLVILIMLVGCGGSNIRKKQAALTGYKQAALEVREYQEKHDVNELHKALNSIDQSLAHYETSNALALKGTILLQLEQTASATPIFERIAHDKTISKAKQADAQNNWATALYQLGSFEKAKILWQELAHNPHYISPELAYYNLGYAELNEAYQTAYRDRSNQNAITRHLEQALEYFKQAIAISHEFIDALFYMGRTLIALNRFVEARETILSILTINPDHHPAQTLLNALEERLTQGNRT